MRKINAILLFLFSLVLFFPVPSLALSLTPGDLVKTSNNPTVYYYGYDGKRHAFPNEKIYFSWYSGFSGVKTVTKDELASLTLGKNILVRPGTYLVKLITDPKVYAVEPLGKLRALVSPAQANDLYGINWQAWVIDLPEAFYSDYQDGGVLDGNKHPTGTVFRYQGEPSFYLLTNGYSRKFVSLVFWSNYRFNDKFILSVPYQDFNYLRGDDIDQYQVALTDTAQTLMESEAADLINYSKGSSNSYSSGTINGLRGTYYNGLNFESKIFERVDNQINFNWALGNPGNGVNNDFFSIRWQGELQVNESRDYTFYIYADDGARFYVDGQAVIINDWLTNHGWDSGSIYLNSGRHSVKLEYYENQYDAVIKLYWNNQTDLIPSNNLYAN